MTDDELKALVANLAVSQDRTDKELQSLFAKMAVAQDRTDAQLAKADARQEKADARQKKADARQEKADARQKKADARQEKIDARQEKIDARQEKADARQKKIDAQQAKNDAQLAKTIAQMERTNNKIDRLAEMYGGVSNNLGSVAEEFYYNSFKANPVLAGKRFLVNKNITRCSDGLEDEFDLLLVNGKEVFVVEVKHKAHKNDLNRLLNKKAHNFRQLFPEYGHLEQRLALAAFHFSDDLKKSALKQGVTVLQRKGDVVETLVA